ncbi:MAG: hypothetical protein LBL39_07975 [Planctomycetaceae bacterium]|nr:hypothetical protein [Planctomycetaceae bacterium]
MKRLLKGEAYRPYRRRYKKTNRPVISRTICEKTFFRVVMLKPKKKSKSLLSVCCISMGHSLTGNFIRRLDKFFL